MPYFGCEGIIYLYSLEDDDTHIPNLAMKIIAIFIVYIYKTGVIEMEKATFGAGCFWGIEEEFASINGVKETNVGYAGGKTISPIYEEVCSGKTGHVEAVEVYFDSQAVSYENLLDVFWQIHDPTALNRQGFDVGTQYKSVIFYHNEDQREKAFKSMKKIENAGIYKNKIVTDIVPAQTFYKAEEYHQKYYKKKGGGSCSI